MERSLVQECLWNYVRIQVGERLNPLPEIHTSWSDFIRDQIEEWLLNEFCQDLWDYIDLYEN
jgi:hypothetical protein